MNREKFNYSLYNYMKENISLYIFSLVLFVMGLIFGSIVIKSLSFSQEQELANYINNFFYSISSGEWQSSKAAFWQILIDNLKYLLLIWFLGLSIIGMPLIFMIIFMKGFVIGFTVSFFISELTWKGFLFSIVSVLPQNMLLVPVFIIAGVSGTLFSLSLIKGRGNKKPSSYQQSFTSYSFLILLLGGVVFLASGFEAFVSPYLMKVITAFLINP